MMAMAAQTEEKAKPEKIYHAETYVRATFHDFAALGATIDKLTVSRDTSWEGPQLHVWDGEATVYGDQKSEAWQWRRRRQLTAHGLAHRRGCAASRRSPFSPIPDLLGAWPWCPAH